jgi:hypothetical protein
LTSFKKDRLGSIDNIFFETIYSDNTKRYLDVAETLHDREYAPQFAVPFSSSNGIYEIKIIVTIHVMLQLLFADGNI